MSTRGQALVRGIQRCVKQTNRLSHWLPMRRTKNTIGKPAMSQMLSKWITTFACTALVAVGLPLIASAGTINIILSDVDVTYAGDQGVGGAIYDVTGLNGGNKNTTEADKVSSAVFEQDMVPIANLMSGGGTDYYADLRIDGVGATVPLAGLNNVGSNAGNFGFDFFSSPGNLAFHLGIDKIDLHLTNGVLFFTGTASNVTSQNLPGGMAFDTSKPIYFSYTATLPGIVGSPATMAVASGAMTISGTMIPEPTTLATLALGLAISSVSCVRRRSRR